jgi:DNA-binding CsgD family transcriptional regulator/tetratricopeptide (TPR) repeat protein
MGGAVGHAEFTRNTPEADASGLLERADQIARLRESFAHVVADSRGLIVLVHGEAGVGKTSLMRYFCASVGNSARVFSAACNPLFVPRPLGPLLDLVDVIGPAAVQETEAAERPFDIARIMLRDFRSGTPAVVVIEDVHWADEASLDVIQLVARGIHGVPVLLVLTYRDDQLDRAHPLRVVLGNLGGRDLTGDRVITRIPLLPLSRAGVSALAEPAGVDPDELHHRTAGNPFFVTEVLAGGSGQIPATVRDAVLARAAAISPAARDLLEAAAVIPSPAERWLLEPRDPAAAAGLDECLDSGLLVVTGDNVAFRHEIARLAVVEALPPGHRAALHRRVLTMLTSHSPAPDLARLTHHAEAAADAQAVLRFAPQAAVQASRSGAHRESARLYACALRYAAGLPPAERAGLLERFADETYLTSAGPAGSEALTEALEIYRDGGDLLGQGRALRLLGRQLGRDGQHQAGLAALTEATSVLERIPATGELALVYANLSATQSMTNYAEAIRLGIKAIELGEATGCAEAVFSGLNNVGAVKIMQGDLTGVADLERSRDLADQAGSEYGVGRAFLHLSWMPAMRREWGIVADHVDAGIAYCTDRGLDQWLDRLVSLRAELALAHGRWDEAIEQATAIVEHGRAGSLVSRFSALLVLAKIRARRGEGGSAALLGDARELATSPAVAPLALLGLGARAEIAWLERRLPAVVAETEVPLNLAWLLQPMTAGEVLSWRWRAGAEVADIVQLPEPYRMQFTGDSRGAAQWWRDRGCLYEAAIAAAGSGDVEALREAIEVLRGLGARAALAIVSRELRALGVQGVPRAPRPATMAHPAGLTQREVDVLTLLAGGMRNAEIATRLVLSPRTVDHHVSSIMRKLGARSRGEAAAMAVRLGYVSGTGRRP